MERERDAPPVVDTPRLAVRAATPGAKGVVFLPRADPEAVGTLRVDVDVDATGAGVTLPSFLETLGLDFGLAFVLGADAFFGAGCRQCLLSVKLETS